MRRWLLLAIAGGLASGVTLGLGPLAAGAQSDAGARLTTFDASASADGVRVGVFVAGAPLANQVVDLGGPTAQALLNSLGRSQAFAAMPYPGDTLLSLPGTIFPVIGLPSPPGYPLIARSDVSTSPQSSITQPGLSLTAKSDNHSSQASASSGGGGAAGGVAAAAATALTRLDDSTGDLTANSQATADVANIQGVLRIGHVSGEAQVVQPASGGVKATSSFAVEGVSIAGVSAAVTDKGIVLPGTTTPVPDTSGLSSVLDGAGVSMKYLVASAQGSSVVSAGLVVSVKEAGPTGNDVVTYTFGRAAASVAGSSSSAAAASTGAGAVPTSTGDQTTLPAPSTGTDTGGLGSPLSAAVASVPGSSVAGSSPRIPRSAVAPTAGPPTRVAPASSTASAASLYLLLVAGAIVAASGLVLVRLFGVKLAWT
jgi:hypothetical protein